MPGTSRLSGMRHLVEMTLSREPIAFSDPRIRRVQRGTGQSLHPPDPGTFLPSAWQLVRRGGLAHLSCSCREIPGLYDADITYR